MRRRNFIIIIIIIIIIGNSKEFGVISRHYNLVNNYLNSHYLSTGQCIEKNCKENLYAGHSWE